MKCLQYNEIGFELFVPKNVPYYVLGFRDDPVVIKKPLDLKGAMLQPGDAVAFIGGMKTSAGFEFLYPVAPARLTYQGLYLTLAGETYVLWLPEIDGQVNTFPPFDEYKHMYYANGYIPSQKALMFTLATSNGNGARVIETDRVYLRHEDIPDEVKIEVGLILQEVVYGTNVN